MNKRHIVIGVGLSILIGAWMLRDGREAPAPDESVQPRDIPYPSAGDHLQPRPQPGTGSPPTYGVDPMSRDPWMQDWRGQGWGTEGYGLRQPEPARQSLDRWQDLYGSPPRGSEWPPSEPGILQEPSQWGAIPPDREPPSHRMYPSLDLHRDRRLTAR